ncbi:uncharacterized protein LOC132259746 [Phlebotomus argentipes]|uniref:uncharacterized protein LOC132259746 n=1 Tax=Phlebotomus argentipes TaxID=94469 RepID=UPI002892A8D7|nr:uncharacterized protein LOC132259746 [Phlebotomus argentipes]
MPLLKNCCFCISLKISGLIVGWIGAVFSCLCIISVVLYIFNSAGKSICCLLYILRGMIFNFDLRFVVAMLAIVLVSHILLIIGTIKRNRFLLLPWITMMGSLGFLCFLGKISSIVNLAVTEDVGKIFVVFFISFLTAIPLYLWLVIVSLFQEIHDEEHRSTPLIYPIYQPNNNYIPNYPPQSATF